MPETRCRVLSVTVATLLVAVLVVVACPAAPAVVAPPADAPADPPYVAPVAGRVSDPFRPPATPYGAGNRGVDIETAPGAPVVAPADGEVTFAGQVGGALHVVVLHPDGIRTTMGFLATVTVHRGQRVRQGDVVGTSGGAVHFGARAGDTYLDPLGLLADGPPRVLLVADDDRRPGPVGRELTGLRRSVRGSSLFGIAAGALGRTARLGRAGAGTLVGGGRTVVVGTGRVVAAAVPWALDLAVEVLPAPVALSIRLLRPSGPVVTLVRVAVTWVRGGGPCTAGAVAEPVLRERRIVVLVPGLDSNLGGGFPHALDTRRLGYAPADTEVFSYRGGTQPYTGEETTVDLRVAAGRLRQFLVARAALDPGVPIDVIAHSQGGLVVRAALTLPPGEGEPPVPPVAHVVTLSSPLTGTPLAAIADGARSHPLLGPVVWAHDRLLGGFDIGGDSLAQMAPGSDLIGRLQQGSFPPGTAVRTIGARYDVVVPAAGAGLDGRPDVVVDAGGPGDAHSAVASSPAGRREVALAINDLPPGCESWRNRAADDLAGIVIRQVELAGRDVVRSSWP